MTKVEIPCDNCQTLFTKIKKEYTRQKKNKKDPKFFCCRECMGVYRTNEKKEYICEECNGVFLKTKEEQETCKNKQGYYQRFCGHKCANTWIGKNLSVESRRNKKEKTKVSMNKWIKENPDKVIANVIKSYESVTKKGYFCSKGERELFSIIDENVERKIQTGGGHKIGRENGKNIIKQFDIYCRETKTIIEYDGICHFKPIYGQQAFEKTKYKDTKLKEWCKENGWSLIRIQEEVYREDKEKWVDILLEHIECSNQEIVEYYNLDYYK
jgi:very-short-patch-repair endonuclease